MCVHSLCPACDTVAVAHCNQYYLRNNDTCNVKTSETPRTCIICHNMSNVIRILDVFSFSHPERLLGAAEREEWETDEPERRFHYGDSDDECSDSEMNARTRKSTRGSEGDDWNLRGEMLDQARLDGEDDAADPMDSSDITNTPSSTLIAESEDEMDQEDKNEEITEKRRLEEEEELEKGDKTLVVDDLVQEILHDALS